MKLQACIIVFILLCSLSRSQSDEPSCTAGIVVMTKEEIRREIREQFTSTCVLSPDIQRTPNRSSLPVNGTRRCFSERQLIQHIGDIITASIVEEIVTNISTMMEGLLQPLVNRLNALHQPGKSPSHPAVSCKEIYDYDPSTPSGWYSIEASDGTAVSRFCDMTRTCGGVTGGWMQVTKLDMRNSSSQCPSGLREIVHPTKRLCGMGIDGGGCSRVNFATDGIGYNQVCGKIIAYQYGSTDGFGFVGAGIGQPRYIDGNYLDGVSLTHGRSPRKHIWTFAAALDEVGTVPVDNCPCTNIHSASGATHPPSFVGNDYFCDTGSQHRFQGDHLYDDDPLWDGAGCGPANTCCSLNNPPWFMKQLSSTARDDIEMRICSNENRQSEDVQVEEVEIYIR